ncbi:TolC family outer membrane protein [Marinobacter sp. CA1]|uniref:TolC family outer membrane protein n=1 Tax=Marinobacter sp. CA1 TaxID=2817656 RepID=UPI001D085A92|nr:TolC family outer membrane protein [Marinobacter sp. CA1]UDL03836.1 TolC family outer membrane protein [Marinobacter sp. CA1]
MFKNAVQRSLLCLGLAAAPGMGVAQGVITLPQAYESALLNNYQLRSEQASLSAEGEATREAWSGVLPQVTATASYGESRFTRDFNVNTSVTDTDEHTRYEVSLSQVIYSHKSFNNISRASAGEDRTRAQFNLSVVNTGFDAVKAYLAAASIKRETTVLEQELESHRRRLLQMQKKQERGFATRADVLDAQTSVDQTVAELAGLRTELLAARQQFVAVTGLDLSESSLAPVDESKWQQVPDLLKTDWLEVALKNSGDLKVARADVQFNEETQDYERAGHFPELYLNARYTENDTFATNLREETRVELQFRLPIYKGGATSARSRQAAYRKEASILALQHQEQLVRVEITRLVEGLQGSHEQINALKTARTSAGQSLEAAERGFEGGVRSLTDLLEARNRLSRTERDLVREVYRNLRMQFELKQIAGVLSEEDLQGLTL